MSLIQEGNNKKPLDWATKVNLKTFIENNGGKVTDPDFTELERYLELNPLEPETKAIQTNDIPVNSEEPTELKP
ncbi:hypothetical protein A2159_00900 [Candidatus Woesebacteria bacterium RBG_13_34_9]|uniref:Uncharacterized protein n=1 Tax=Candidatus Woesebacteria bacterium RBG_13_34_9 TaxID=1802477 RepID=A0A1F7X300_9BACT|nr:MAG: hypothetical protein A2159_00900 [Candidatus Woesebacteria bacterium RBG_13_34_9]